MNHLAHALIGCADDDLMLGSMTADFVRGALDPALPRDVRIGIALHRAVDRYTDAHAEVALARELFAPPLRRYAGILIDVWFDHLLARGWNDFGTGNLELFSDRVRALLAARAVELPPRMRAFAQYMEANRLPAAYRERAMIGGVLHGLSTRLSRPNPLAGALPTLESRAKPLERHFEVFFPQLRAWARAEQARLEGTMR